MLSNALCVSLQAQEGNTEDTCFLGVLQEEREAAVHKHHRRMNMLGLPFQRCKAKGPLAVLAIFRCIKKHTGCFGNV